MIAESLAAIRSALPAGVSLVAVSKFHPVERLMEAYAAGQRLFGENRPQELAAKVPRMPADVQWHFIGHLQTNKLKLVLPYVALVQSVDSRHLLDAIAKWGRENGKRVDILLELHLGAEETKQGFTEAELWEVLDSLPDGIRVRGLMGMATHTDDSLTIEADFARIQDLFNRIQASGVCPDAFDQLSIGMSTDWPQAVKHGATMVRIGTDIFGPREY
ncbi:MAG: YggS family pyridoxal phosphate-dependent enzyme [Bacteroidales bacterium]|nr:YggS family pyridoxal phosphate-dependent enzyme [Bacteroidales bacterium]